jgi:hypothetical protein
VELEEMMHAAVESHYPAEAGDLVQKKIQNVQQTIQDALIFVKRQDNSRNCRIVLVFVAQFHLRCQSWGCYEFAWALACLQIAAARSLSHCKFFWFRLPEKKGDERRLVVRALRFHLLPWQESHDHLWFFLWMIVAALVLQILLLSEGKFFRDLLPERL